jgi:quercetin dioxygenase-like cupin family protein
MPKQHDNIRHLFFVSLALLIGVSTLAAARERAPKPTPRLVELNPTAREYMPVLNGPPETVTMRSGLVVLPPAKSVGKHSTEASEEAVIVFAGVGEMRITGGPTFKLKPSVVAYCPPFTEHDVINTGAQPLRYLYIVAKANP